MQDFWAVDKVLVFVSFIADYRDWILRTILEPKNGIQLLAGKFVVSP